MEKVQNGMFIHQYCVFTALQNLMESQFDCNPKFKDKINELTVEEMRFLPIGRDKHGLAYWYFLVSFFLVVFVLQGFH